MAEDGLEFGACVLATRRRRLGSEPLSLAARVDAASEDENIQKRCNFEAIAATQAEADAEDG